MISQANDRPLMGNGMQHQARKRFGQNFLHDQSIIDRIIYSINPQVSDHLVEIGPGQGAITNPLASVGARGRYLHATVGFPIKITWLEAIKAE